MSLGEKWNSIFSNKKLYIYSEKMAPTLVQWAQFPIHKSYSTLRGIFEKLVNYFWKTTKLKIYLDMFFTYFDYFYSTKWHFSIFIMYFTRCDIGIKFRLTRTASGKTDADLFTVPLTTVIYSASNSHNFRIVVW